MNNVVNYKYKVSIILPCYNVACYIDNAVNAILTLIPQHFDLTLFISS